MNFAKRIIKIGPIGAEIDDVHLINDYVETIEYFYLKFGRVVVEIIL